MRRDELIEVIDRLGSDSLEVGERARLLGIIHYEAVAGHLAPIPVRATIRRGVSCAYLVVRHSGFVSEEEMRRFRPAERGLGMSILYIAFLGVMILSFSLGMGWIIKFIEFMNLGSMGITLFPFLGAFIVYVIFFWLLPRGGPPKLEQYQRFGRSCIGCGYDLSGLESALGDELWVGPTVCPECGQAYPAVGE